MLKGFVRCKIMKFCLGTVRKNYKCCVICLIMDGSSKKCYETEFLYNDTTEFYADSVEWCPFSEYADYLACGTYQLEETEVKSDETQTRKGGVALYQLVSKEACVMLRKVYSYDSGGVLDMKWCPLLYENCAHLIVACSNGQVLLLKLVNERNSVSLKLVSCQTLDGNAKNMVLSVDWSCESEMNVIASDTSGSLNYLTLKDSSLLLLNRWKAHNFESWICAFDYAQPHVLFSGGDDCCFKGWDLRSLSSSTFVNKRHSMGVTAISKSRKREHLLVTGSYDENVFLWDTRSIKSPLSEVSVGGGVWRLKWHPHNPDYLLSASMHNGFHVLSVTNDSLDVISNYKKHESLAYGVDWCWLNAQNEDSLNEINSRQKISNFIASCSFYDKLLHIWKINL